jgi:hypothetical protein
MIRAEGRWAFTAIRDTRDKAAPAHRDDDVIEFRQVLDDLEAHGTLASDHVGIVEGGDNGQAPLFRQLIGSLVRIVVGLPVSDHLSAVAPTGLGLGVRSGGRHDDNGRDVQPSRRHRDSLRMIARASCDDSPLPHLRREIHDLVEGAAQLERARPLEHLRF